MADAIRRGILQRAHFAMQDAGEGAPFRKRVQIVRAWRWSPQFHEGSIVHEPGMVRLDPVEGEAWVHPSGVVIPDNGNPAHVLQGSARLGVKLGDVVIQHADGTREVMSAERFVQEYEPE